MKKFEVLKKKNTKKKKKNRNLGCSVVQVAEENKGYNPSLLTYETGKLDEVLSKYFAEVRTKNSKFERNSKH